MLRNIVVVSTTGFGQVEALDSGSQFNVMKFLLSEITLQLEVSLTVGEDTGIQSCSHLGINYYICVHI